MAIFEVFFGTTLVGYSRLERGDPPMGVAFGLFIPSNAYRAIQQQCIENHADQTALNLTLRTPTHEVIPCASVAILDASPDFGEEGIELNVLGIPYPLYGELFPEHVARYEQLFR